jgi:hypothetical protein
LRFGLGHAAGMFGGEAMCLLFCASLRLFFGQASSLLFSPTTLGCFSAKLCFNLCTEAGFLFSAAAGLRFSFASGFFFGALALSFSSQTLGFLLGPQAGLFTSLHALDLFFDGAESCFGPPAQFFFLRAPAGFGFQIVTLFFGALAGLLLFRLSQSRDV